ncbi:hypothetical protein [Roseobacter sp. S98]|uniref:hypothetical protein n=1 Tax=Roseobacter algicola (ex Choi et al. 2025) (nom. illeg.) TaxID=3092138 RepID=UPI0035C689B9
MPFSPERVQKAFQYWRMLPLNERTERELRLCLDRHGLVEVDAHNYARDLIRNASDLKPFGNPDVTVLSTWWEIIPESEGPAAVDAATDTGVAVE